MISCGKYFVGLLMYYDVPIGVVRKKSLMSKLINCHPLCASEITLFTRSFFPSSEAAGDP